MTKMLEKMALAMFPMFASAADFNADGPESLEDALAFERTNQWGRTHPLLDDAREAARAALQVIRDPDGAMLAPFAYLEAWQMPDTKGRWTAMIDATLAEEPETGA